jgi:hypothetical protein
MTAYCFQFIFVVATPQTVRSFPVDMTWLEIPAVVIILSVVGIVVIRAFASSRVDNIGLFIRRSFADERKRN